MLDGVERGRLWPEADAGAQLKWPADQIEVFARAGGQSSGCAWDADADSDSVGDFHRDIDGTTEGGGSVWFAEPQILAVEPKEHAESSDRRARGEEGAAAATGAGEDGIDGTGGGLVRWSGLR